MSDDVDPLGPADAAALRAAEYVLGVLTPVEARAIEADAAVEPALAEEIALWERHLAPLAGLVPAVAAPPVLWQRLALATGIDSVMASAPEPRRGLGGASMARVAARPRGLGVWRAMTAGSMALAASLAFLLLFHGAAPTPLLAALSPYGAPGATFLVRVGANGAATVVAVGDTNVPQGRSLQLWAVAGTAAPVSMGLLPANGRAELSIPAAPGTQLLVSQEPAGGSPGKGPTGPVVYGGKLTPL